MSRPIGRLWPSDDDEDGDDVGEDDYKRVHREGNHQLLRGTMIMTMMTEIFFKRPSLQKKL